MVAWSVDPTLLKPGVNVIRLLMHPAIVSRIVNLAEFRAAVVPRLQRQVAITQDNDLAALLDEVTQLQLPENDHDPASQTPSSEILIPLRVRTPFGIELSFPADAATEAVLRSLPRP
jgi:hypothetical protein